MRIAAERRGAPRSAAEHRGAPRSTAEHRGVRSTWSATGDTKFAESAESAKCTECAERPGEGWSLWRVCGHSLTEYLPQCGRLLAATLRIDGTPAVTALPPPGIGISAETVKSACYVFKTRVIVYFRFDRKQTGSPRTLRGTHVSFRAAIGGCRPFGAISAASRVQRVEGRREAAVDRQHGVGHQGAQGHVVEHLRTNPYTCAICPDGEDKQGRDNNSSQQQPAAAASSSRHSHSHSHGHHQGDGDGHGDGGDDDDDEDNRTATATTTTTARATTNPTSPPKRNPTQPKIVQGAAPGPHLDGPGLGSRESDGNG
eukprot:gene10743-biopygen8514